MSRAFPNRTAPSRRLSGPQTRWDTSDAESAIVQMLAPGAYTAIVRGKDNTTGVALVEAYQLDN